MTQKTLGWVLIGLIVLLLGGTLLGQKLLFDAGDRHFTREIEAAMEKADAGDWAGAEQAANRANDLWNQGNFLVAVKYAESDYTLLNLTLTRFRAEIAHEDASGARREGASCLYLFENITAPAPQP
jgi:hypothetical protein